MEVAVGDRVLYAKYTGQEIKIENEEYIVLAERDLLGSNAGRDTFAVLLFQDLAFIPLVALAPALGGASIAGDGVWLDIAKMAGGVVAILAASPRDRIGVANGILGVSRTAGMLLGVALGGAGLISPPVAAWSPALVGSMLGTLTLLYSEDG